MGDYALGGPNDIITPRLLIKALGEGNWPWRSGDGITPAMSIMESPGSVTSKYVSNAALQLDTPLEKVKFVKPGQLPVARPLEDYKQWLDHPIPNVQLPPAHRIHADLYSENDVVRFRSLLLYDTLSSLYDVHRLVTGTKIRLHQDSTSGTNTLRPDIAVEIYYAEYEGDPSNLPAWNSSGSPVAENEAMAEFARLKQHILNPAEGVQQSVQNTWEKLFATAAEIKPDRVLAVHLKAMLELAEFDNRWEGMPKPPPSLHRFLARGSTYDAMGYRPPLSSRRDSSGSSFAVLERAGAIWTQVCMFVAMAH